MCLVPRGAEEGATVEIDSEALQLVANRPVSFRLYSSLTRTEDKLGEVVQFAPDEELHSTRRSKPSSVLARRRRERLMPVKLGARLTEIGTLETWCESKISENRWRLQFELRKVRAAAAPGIAQGPPPSSARKPSMPPANWCAPLSPRRDPAGRTAVAASKPPWAWAAIPGP